MTASRAGRHRRPGLLGDAVVVLAAFLLVGVAAAVLWWLLADPPRYSVTRRGPAMGEVELGRQFAIDGWYAVLAALLGGGTGLVLTWWRSRDPLATVLLVLPASGLAALVAARLGTALGPPDPQRVLADAEVGSRVPEMLSVSDPVFWLVWPIAALAGSLMVLWSSAGPRRSTDFVDPPHERTPSA